MDKMELIQQIFELCIVPLLAVLTGYIVTWIKAKTAEIEQNKYTDLISDTIIQCVIATNQTYVEALKKEGKFDAEAQEKAFEITKQAVLAVLTNQARDFIEMSYGDVEAWLNQQIEATINTYKKV
jgi:hypothetical protein